MSHAFSSLSTEEKRELLRRRVSEGALVPRTYPTSFPQRRLWFMHQLAPQSPSYNVEAALPMSAVDARALEAAINALVARHESLRTTFREIDGEPIQVVAPELHVPLVFRDLAGLPPDRREAEQLAQRQRAAIEPFNLARGPLLRTELLRMGPAQHLFLLNLHHIIADGWSMGVLSRELGALYAAALADAPSPLEALPIQYGDFAVWQRREMDGVRLEAQLTYWTRKLEGLRPLDLCTDRPRPAVQSFAGAFHNTEFPSGLTEALKSFSRRRGVTLFMTLLAGFKALLARYAGQTDVAVGTYVANRDRAEIEGLIGFFLNTLVLRTELPDDASFEGVLEAVKETALGAYAHQALPFERLVEALQPPRDLSRNPLVQVVFQLQNATSGDGGGDAALIDYQRAAAAFDIAVTAYEQGGSLHFTYEYATDLFDAETIARFADRLQRLLAAAIADPAARIGALDVLSPVERRDLLAASRGPALDHPLGRSVPELFAARAALTPDATAFYQADAAASIGQLADCADRIAHALARAGVRKGEVVGVCLDRSVELAATLLAVWKAGGVYLPLDPAYPAERRAFMAKDAGARVVVARASADLPAGAELIRIADAIGDFTQPQPRFADVAITADDPSHIIYTSGSTGLPKGSLCHHRQVLNRLHWMWRAMPHGDDECEAVKTPTSFIDSLWELLGPLIAGRPALIVDAATMLEPQRLVELLGRYGVSRLWVTPSYLRLLLEAAPDLGARLPQLRFWVATGEALAGDIVHAFRRAAPEARLFNLYGTSEAWDVACDEVAGPDTPLRGRAAIGRPIDNVVTLVLDPQRRPVPTGVPGELFVCGPGVCSRFLNRPDLDAERLTVLEIPGLGRLPAIATGDRVRWRADDRLEFVGRADDELKISGMRVHPAEVEAVLNACPGVGQAVVAGVVGADGVARLQAWWTAASATPPDARQLRAALARNLPEHMIPESFTRLDALPVTPSGKADRRALAARALEPAQPTAAEADRGPATEAERIVLTAFAEVLAKPVGVDENFFAAGGHSLLAARALARINERLSVQLRIQDLFANPTAAGLAIVAGDAAPATSEAAIPRLARRAEAASAAP